MQKALISASKTKNARNRIPLRQKDAPFNGGLSQPPFDDDLWRETKKIRSPSFCSCTMSSSQVSSDTMLDFYHLINMIQDLISKNNMHNNNHKRQETHRFFLGETIKQKTRNFLRDIMNTNNKIKTQKHKDDLRQLLSLLLVGDPPLSLMCYS